MFPYFVEMTRGQQSILLLGFRQRRGERAVNAREWWEQERQRVVNKDFSEDVYNMYKDVLQYEKFRRKFITTWQLAEDYKV